MLCRSLPIAAVLLGALTCCSGCDSDSATADVRTGSTASPAEKNSAEPAPSNPVGPALDSQASLPKPGTRPGDRTKALEKAGDRTYDKTFDDIRFEMEIGAPFKRSMLTPQIEGMVGQRIRIRGYMLPTAQKRGIKQFVLVRDNQECCFGPGAALYDCIFVEMQPGKSAEFSIRPLAVTGTFSVNEIVGPDGNHLAIYRLDAEEVTL